MNFERRIPSNAKAVLRIMEKIRYYLYKTIDSWNKFEALGMVGLFDNNILLNIILECQRKRVCSSK